MVRPASVPPDPGGHLLVRAPDTVGDLVRATPVLEAARLAVADPRAPWTRLSVLVPADLVPVLTGGALDPHAVPLERGADEPRLLAELAPDAVLLLTDSFRAAWRARRAGIALRAGAAVRGRGPLLTHRLVPVTRAGRTLPLPTAHLQRDLGALLGLFPESPHPRLAVTDAEAERALALRHAAGFGADEPYVLVCPGAGPGPAGLWPPPRYAEAVEALHGRHGLRALVAGLSGEERPMESVAASAPHATSLAGEERDLGGLKALVRDAALLLVGDAGPRWLAAGFDTPCVSVLGPSASERAASSLQRCELVRVEGLPCAPCLDATCPLDHHACMVDLPTRAVVEAADRLLSRSAS